MSDSSSPRILGETRMPTGSGIYERGSAPQKCRTMARGILKNAAMDERLDPVRMNAAKREGRRQYTIQSREVET